MPPPHSSSSQTHPVLYSMQKMAHLPLMLLMLLL
jgi:hypothetical protein